MCRTSLEDVVRAIVRDELARVLAERGERGAREYASRGGLLPPSTSARTLAREARAMLAAGIPGVRREGRGKRDRIYFVDADAWHRWRTSARSRAADSHAPSDGDLAEVALNNAGLRMVGWRRGGPR
jgi:hypothetical protein